VILGLALREQAVRLDAEALDGLRRLVERGVVVRVI